MKRLVWILAVLMLASPAWAARKITVGQLEDLLRSLQQENKTDADVAAQLKQIELTEELTRKAMNGMVKYVPGPLSTEQIYVLEARSADLIPPASDLPATPALDAAARQAILARAETYVKRTYEQLPSLTATKATLRFQDNMEAVASCSGVVGCAQEYVDTTPGYSNPASFVHYISSAVTPVVSEHGAEKLSPEKDKTRWGANRMIALREPDPSLAVVFEEARDAGSIQWLRWELVNGRQVAVYSFAVPKAKAHLTVDICCFPNINQTGIARFYTPLTANTIAGDEAAGGGSGGVTGNFQTNTDWRDYKAIAPYHGEFFIDPDTGIVVRMITEAELNPSEVVHQVDTRIDYGPVKVGARILVAPVRTIVNTEVVPNGTSGVGGYSTRRTLFTSEYKDYQPAAPAR
ncbi:MAG TPA: hypothetical protein VKG86_05590 [Terracidiphilus sp.]|nr:hypothetical protein [Terracidiphilus sp.]